MSCWLAKARNALLSQWASRAKIFSLSAHEKFGCYGRNITQPMTGGVRGSRILTFSRPRHRPTLNYGRSACANWRRWPRESALNQNFVIQQFGGFYSLPPARFIAQLSMKEDRVPDALQPADSPLSSPDASAIHPSSAPDATQTRMSAPRARPAGEERKSKLAERIQSARTQPTGSRHPTPSFSLVH